MSPGSKRTTRRERESGLASHQRLVAGRYGPRRDTPSPAEPGQVQETHFTWLMVLRKAVVSPVVSP
jgi:hypothetical protein